MSARSLLQSEERFFLKISATQLRVLAWALFPVTFLINIQKSLPTFKRLFFICHKRKTEAIGISHLGSLLGHLFSHGGKSYCPLPLFTGPMLQPLHKLAALEQANSTGSGAVTHPFNPLVAHSPSAPVPQLYWMPQGPKFSRLPWSLGIAHLNPNILTGPHYIL